MQRCEGILKLDPRTKFLTVTALLVATLLSGSAVSLGGRLVLLVLVFMVSRTSWQRLFRNVALLSWLLIFTFFANLLGVYSETGSWLQGIQASGFTVIRLAVLVGWGMFLGTKLSYSELVAGLEILLRPFDRLGFPVQKLSVVVMLSLRFIPILRQEQQALIHAHIARGIDIDAENFWKRIKRYVLLCGPLFLSMLRRVEQVTLAMDARAFSVQAARTRLYAFRMTMIDYLIIGLGGLAIAATLCLRI